MGGCPAVTPVFPLGIIGKVSAAASSFYGSDHNQIPVLLNAAKAPCLWAASNVFSGQIQATDCRLMISD